MEFEFKFPKIGETASGGTLIRWLKSLGEVVDKDEPIVEVSTDKIATELASPISGTITRLLAQEGDEVSPGDVLALIEEKILARVTQSPCSSDNKTHEHFTKEETSTKTSSLQDKLDWISPAVLTLLKDEGLSIDILKNISGSGESGRITKKDLEMYLQSRKSKNSIQSSNDDSRITMSPLRKAIASSLAKSSEEVPHASLMIDVDVTDLTNLIANEKERFLVEHGVKLTVTSFIILCLSKSLEKFPLLNGSLDGDSIIVKKSINVGVAVNLNKEGVIVPVIHNCQDRSIDSIAKALADLSYRARNNLLESSEVNDGSVTVTNFGMTGALLGIPIIRYPEVAILGIGTIQKRVVVRDDDALVVRKMMYITLTFDHRVLDGIYGSEFLASLKNQLESVTIS